MRERSRELKGIFKEISQSKPHQQMGKLRLRPLDHKAHHGRPKSPASQPSGPRENSQQYVQHKTLQHSVNDPKRKLLVGEKTPTWIVSHQTECLIYRTLITDSVQCLWYT